MPEAAVGPNPQYHHTRMLQLKHNFLLYWRVYISFAWFEGVAGRKLQFACGIIGLYARGFWISNIRFHFVFTIFVASISGRNIEWYQFHPFSSETHCQYLPRKIENFQTRPGLWKCCFPASGVVSNIPPMWQLRCGWEDCGGEGFCGRGLKGWISNICSKIVFPVVGTVRVDIYVGEYHGDSVFHVQGPLGMIAMHTPKSKGCLRDGHGWTWHQPVLITMTQHLYSSLFTIFGNKSNSYPVTVTIFESMISFALPGK